MFEWAVHYYDTARGQQCLDTYPLEREAREEYGRLMSSPGLYWSVTLMKRGPMPPWKPTR